MSNSNKNTYYTCASSFTTKLKLSEVNYVSTKALDSHIDNHKNLGYTIQYINIIHSNISILVWIERNGLVELTNFDKIDEHFSYKHFLVPQTDSQNTSLEKRIMIILLCLSLQC